MNYSSFGAVSTVYNTTVAILCMIILRRVRFDLFGELCVQVIMRPCCGFACCVMCAVLYGGCVALKPRISGFSGQSISR